MVRNKLFKSVLYYFIASLVVILFARYIHIGLVYLDAFYIYMNLLITPIFNQAGLGKIIHQMILLVLIPILIVSTPALVYRLIKHQTMPYFLPLTWGVWLVLTLSTLTIH